MNLGVFILERGNMRGDQTSSHAKGRRNEKRPSWRLGDFVNSGFGLVHGIQDRHRLVVEDAALFGRLDRARRSCEQPDTKLFLQLAHTA